MVETQYPALHLQEVNHIQLLPDARSHEWSSEAEQAVVAQLVRLASQHHVSEYNCLKFGPKGCPIPYVPFSLHMPERFRQLQAHQARYAAQQAWWLCETKDANTSMVVETVTSLENVPRRSDPPFAPNIQQELAAAISSPLVSLEHPLPATVQDQSQIKTSSSHPINISPVIPTELLRIISAQLTLAGDSSPVMFELPSSHSLDRVTAQLPKVVSHPPPSTLQRPYTVLLTETPSVPLPCPSMHTLSRPGRLSHLLWNNLTLRRTLHSSVNTQNKWSRPMSAVIPTPSLPMKTRAIVIQDMWDEDTSLINSSLRRSLSASALLKWRMPKAPSAGQVCASERVNAFQAGRKSTSNPDLQTASKACSPSVMNDKSPPRFPRRALPIPISVGNLLLSSCPGKKVRLNGPVKGRCGVCRDLRTDMERIKGLEVACLICCLDDEELEMLGISWTEYSSIADELGIDILRIPAPEGLAPASLPDFDAQLTKVIDKYTLHGMHVLVHCRGGVGRAGLVACCWMLKLGLCGWIETSPSLAFTAPEDLPIYSVDAKPNSLRISSPIRRDTMQLVERAITVVRRRRSLKAVETYEQVRFLVDFVDHQRARSAQGVVHSQGRPDWTGEID